MLKYSDIPMLKEFIRMKNERVAELEQLPPTTERFAEIARITAEAKMIQRDIQTLKGNMYPYAS